MSMSEVALMLWLLIRGAGAISAVTGAIGISVSIRTLWLAARCHKPCRWLRYSAQVHE